MKVYVVFYELDVGYSEVRGIYAQKEDAVAYLDSECPENKFQRRSDTERVHCLASRNGKVVYSTQRYYTEEWEIL